MLCRCVFHLEHPHRRIAREMRRDPTVVCLGEDIGEAEGVFKTTVGLFKEFGPERSAKLQFVCSDMWAAYLKVIAKKAPQALNVLDRRKLLGQDIHQANRAGQR